MNEGIPKRGIETVIVAWSINYFHMQLEENQESLYTKYEMKLRRVLIEKNHNFDACLNTAFFNINFVFFDCCCFIDIV